MCSNGEVYSVQRQEMMLIYRRGIPEVGGEGAQLWKGASLQKLAVLRQLREFNDMSPKSLQLVLFQTSIVSTISLLLLKKCKCPSGLYFRHK